MADTIGRDEFNKLDDRVRVVERDLNGEKQVTRYVLEQVRRNGDDLAAIKTRMERVEVAMSELKSEFGDLRGDFGGQKQALADLRKEMPGIVADAMREVLGKTTTLKPRLQRPRSMQVPSGGTASSWLTLKL